MHEPNVLADEEREWIDWRWGWLLERLGAERVRIARVYTRPQQFLSSTRPLSAEGMEALAVHVAKQMGLGDRRVVIVTSYGETVDQINDYEHRLEQAMQETSALVAGVGHDEFAAPERAVIGLIRSLTASYLDRMGWLDGMGPGARVAGELAAVMLGAGVILANNAVITQNSSDGAYSYFQTERTSVLSEPGLAYAVARFALLRSQPDDLLKGLKADPKSVCKQYLDSFESVPPPVEAPKPGWVLDTWEEVEAAAEAEAEHEEGWTEDDLLPANLHDVVAEATRYYCIKCAHELSGLPAGECPGCSAAFDPEDLRTVTTFKPKPISEEKRLALEKRNRTIKKFVKWAVYLFGAFMVIGIMFECANR